MGLADRDYMKDQSKASKKPPLLARHRFALWRFRKWLGSLFGKA